MTSNIFEKLNDFYSKIKWKQLSYNSYSLKTTYTFALYINLQINIKEMFSKQERDTNNTKRRITPELISYPSSVIDSSVVESTPLPLSLANNEKEDPDTDQTECVICYESLSSTKNMCITECGHKFCFSCMMKHAQRSTDCPLCRTAIIENVSDSESEFDEDGLDNDGSDSEEDDEDEDEETIDDSYAEFEIEKFVEIFEAKGYGLKDALSLLLHKFSKTDDKYTKAYVNKLDTDVEDICEELQNECEEREEMESEDRRV